MVKRILITLSLLLVPCITSAYTSDSMINNTITITVGSTYSYNIPSGYDFILTNVEAIDEKSGEEFMTIYDDTSAIYYADFEYKKFVYLKIWDILKIENNNAIDITLSYSWYLVYEGDVVYMSSLSDVFYIIKNFLISEKSFEIFSIFSVWIIVFFFIYQTIFVGFRVGYIFAKKLLWKR